MSKKKANERTVEQVAIATGVCVLTSTIVGTLIVDGCFGDD
ncbi:hypothetical protein [Actinokineospora globicatena]|nr:hypothetical protein [Actinokineospora globicatena]MCP2304156.1 hypothetical protein [Actinokineospora globicatena]GLW78487.1 hypothetical protein Aglo01_29690 [Actinokineospora globicatena]GLW84849.1 hypothetical protein Aglo02_24890 [Actinokineospora globicatena]